MTPSKAKVETYVPVTTALRKMSGLLVLLAVVLAANVWFATDPNLEATRELAAEAIEYTQTINPWAKPEPAWWQIWK